VEVFTLPYEKNHESCIRKITVFKSEGISGFRQKLTPTPYSCLSYNHFHIPEFIVNSATTPVGNRLQVTGPKTRDDVFALHNGKLCQVLIEFTAVGFYCFFHCSPVKYLNATVALGSLVPLCNVQILTNDLSRTDDHQQHAALIQQFLATLNLKMCNQLAYLNEAVKMIEDSKGNTTVKEITRQINVSERQLDRKFIEITGLKPMQYIKLKQLHYIISLLQKKQFKTLKELAYEAGFYDPAHFNNQFRKLTGMSPGAFLASDEHVAFKYYND
jgi:AraC-like DNA-binding protein